MSWRQTGCRADFFGYFYVIMKHLNYITYLIWRTIIWLVFSHYIYFQRVACPVLDTWNFSYIGVGLGRTGMSLVKAVQKKKRLGIYWEVVNLVESTLKWRLDITATFMFFCKMDRLFLSLKRLLSLVLEAYLTLISIIYIRWIKSIL